MITPEQAAALRNKFSPKMKSHVIRSIQKMEQGKHYFIEDIVSLGNHNYKSLFRDIFSIGEIKECFKTNPWHRYNRVSYSIQSEENKLKAIQLVNSIPAVSKERKSRPYTRKIANSIPARKYLTNYGEIGKNLYLIHDENTDQYGYGRFEQGTFSVSVKPSHSLFYLMTERDQVANISLIESL